MLRDFSFNITSKYNKIFHVDFSKKKRTVHEACIDVYIFLPGI